MATATIDVLEMPIARIRQTCGLCFLKELFARSQA
jgi:hypothetical protein